MSSPEDKPIPNCQNMERKPAQSTDSATPNLHSLDEHVMPGLVPKVATTFRTPKKHFTVRAVVNRRRVKPGIVISALLHDLYDQVDDLRSMVARRSVASETSVRDFRSRVA